MDTSASDDIVDNEPSDDIVDSEPSDDIVDNEPVYYHSKNNQITWSTVPREIVATTKFQGSPGKVTGEAACANTPDECFSLFFSPSMIHQIVQLTNQNIKEHVERKGLERTLDNNVTNEVEIKAFFGILLLTALYLYERDNELWDTSGYGADIFRATMSYSRFSFLLKCITYSSDTVVGVSDFLDTFSKNCQDNFELGSYATLEKQLIPCKAVRSCGVVSGSGVSLLSVRDARVNYTHACVFHWTDEDITDQVTKVTSRLLSPDRLIVSDHSLTTMTLVDYFSASDTFFLGQINNNAEEIPPELSAVGTATGQVPCLVYHKNTTLIRHADRCVEPVFLVCNLTGVENALPDVLETYDALAGQSNVVDAMCKSYSCAKKTPRWDIAVLFRLLDIACINTHIIYTIISGGDGLSRRQFIKKLSGELTRRHMIARTKLNGLPASVRQVAARIANVPCSLLLAANDLPPAPGNKRRCQVCPKPNDCKSSYLCCGCKRCICRKRGFLFCRECVNMNNSEPSTSNQ